MRDRAYRRAQTRRVIARREAIVRNVYQFAPAETQIWAGHRLDKGKVHCSCQLCSVKTNPRRCKLNGGWKHSDKKRLLRGADEAPFSLVSINQAGCGRRPIFSPFSFLTSLLHFIFACKLTAPCIALRGFNLHLTR